MKVGVLTFHSQLNYGGVLQCWALVHALRAMGHDVEVVDRWLTPDNQLLNGPFGRAGVTGWGMVALKGVLGCGTLWRALRYWRTRRFVKSLGLTQYHFYNWTEAPRDLGLDCLVVGSDQVWHGGDWGWPTPLPYLLEGAPSINAIAYAASFGMKSLPMEYDYVAGFKRFKAISVREAEGVVLVAGTGYSGGVAHVVDPTLLLNSTEWSKLGKWRKVSGRLLCYFLSERVSDAVKILGPWARKNHFTVEIVSDGQGLPMPRTVRSLFCRLGEQLRSLLYPSHVKISSGYGPKEFVRCFARAEMCITDSFHAVMFSAIYNCNTRFLRPRIEGRRSMFSRVEEFAQASIDGTFVENDLMSALSSFEKGERMSFRPEVIHKRREESAAWLKTALNTCTPGTHR